VHKNLEQRRACGRKRQQRYLLTHSEANRTANRKYRKAHPDRIQAKDALADPEKVQARRILNKAIKTGKIARQNCWCGKVGEAHHPDYSKPLEVIWLCSEHHAQVHKSY
jgi:hypothetical protein